jgi:hypothetical protein
MGLSPKPKLRIFPKAQKSYAMILSIPDHRVPSELVDFFCGMILATIGFAGMSVRRIPSFRPTSFLLNPLRMIPSLKLRS